MTVKSVKSVKLVKSVKPVRAGRTLLMLMSIVGICAILGGLGWLGWWLQQQARRQQQQQQQQQQPVDAQQPPRADPHALGQAASSIMRVAMDPNVSGAPPATLPQIGYLILAAASAPAVRESDGAAAQAAPATASSSPLALYGGPSNVRRGRWHYYVIVGAGVKVPLRVGSRQCLLELGCDELYDGDEVTVQDAPARWVVRLYKAGGM